MNTAVSKLSGIVIFCSAALLAGCSASVPPLPVKISSVRPPLSGTETIKLDIKRADYQATLKDHDLLRRLRLVQIVYKSDQSGIIPEYRLFEVLPGSPAALLGLQATDILVAANDYIIHDPPKFKAYLMLLAGEKEGFIEIRRGSTPILFKYRFID